MHKSNCVKRKNVCVCMLNELRGCVINQHRGKEASAVTSQASLKAHLYELVTRQLPLSLFRQSNLCVTLLAVYDETVTLCCIVSQGLVSYRSFVGLLYRKKHFFLNVKQKQNCCSSKSFSREGRWLVILFRQAN